MSAAVTQTSSTYSQAAAADVELLLVWVPLLMLALPFTLLA